MGKTKSKKGKSMNPKIKKRRKQGNKWYIRFFKWMLKRMAEYMLKEIFDVIIRLVVILW